MESQGSLFGLRYSEKEESFLLIAWDAVKNLENHMRMRFRRTKGEDRGLPPRHSYCVTNV